MEACRELSVRRGEYATATEQLKNATSGTCYNYPEAHYRSGVTYMRAGEKQAAKERAAKSAEEARAEARKALIEQQFSSWDGSHIALEQIIKKSMHNPDSYKHVETRYADEGDYILVATTFRGTNAFGGVVTNTVRAKFALNGELIEMVSE